MYLAATGRLVSAEKGRYNNKVGYTHNENTGVQEYFEGDVDEVRVYNRALTGTEVEDIYGGTEVATGLQARWQLDDAVTRYAMAGNQVLAEYAADADGDIALSRKFVYGAYIDEPLMMINSDGGTETEYFYHRNRNYNVIALTDENGNEVERYTYSAYGEVVVLVDGNTGNPYFFTGRRLDDETGLMYYRARYYDGELGRFIGRDPLEYVDGMGLYTYARNSAQNFVDPTGDNILLKAFGLHRKVCVCVSSKMREKLSMDTPEGDNLCFSFAPVSFFSISARTSRKAGHSWLGFKGLTLTRRVGGTLGRIYVDNEGLSWTLREKKTSVDDDIKWVKYMLHERVGTPDIYNLGKFNCQLYSDWEYAFAPDGV